MPRHGRSDQCVALDDAELRAFLDGFASRRDLALKEQVANPYPPEGAWHYCDFALSALYRNVQVEEANAAIVRLAQEFAIDPDPQRVPGGPEIDDGHWHINLLQRIYFLFHGESAYFPGRLTAEAEAALLKMFWDSARRHCRIEYADPERTWWVLGQRVWFSSELKRTEGAGWVFAQAPQVFAAWRVVRGGTKWTDPMPEDGAPGQWLECKDEYAPIIFEVAPHSAYDSVDEFQKAVRATPLAMDDGVLKHRSATYGDTFVFHADSTDRPEVNGVAFDFQPAKIYDNPFIESEWGSGVVVLRKGDRQVVLDFTDE